MPAYELSPPELRSEQRAVLRGSAVAAAVCAAVFGLAHFFLPKLVRFPAADLESLLTFWAGASLFIVVWLIVGIRMVSSRRRRSAQDIQGSAYGPPSPGLAVPAAFLQNTLEQVTVMLVTQFAMLILLRDVAMPLVIASISLFAGGRVAFYIGYPKGAGARSFGMALSALPSLLALVLALSVVVRRALT